MTEKKGFFDKMGSWLKDTFGKKMENITPKVSEMAEKVGDKLEAGAKKIAEKIPGGEHLQEFANNTIEKSVNAVGSGTKELVESSKKFV